MVQVALVAYLSLTTVIGPALCCCNARQLFSSATHGPECCGKPGSSHSDAHKAHHAAHDHHHHGHAHHRHDHPPVSDESNSKQCPAPQDHDGQNCPCGQHHASLVAMVTDGGQAKAGEMQNQTRLVLVAISPLLPEFDAQEAALAAHCVPADRAGRDMLRAYQIMRC